MKICVETCRCVISFVYWNHVYVNLCQHFLESRKSGTCSSYFSCRHKTDLNNRSLYITSHCNHLTSHRKLAVFISSGRAEFPQRFSHQQLLFLVLIVWIPILSRPVASRVLGSCRYRSSVSIMLKHFLDLFFSQLDSRGLKIQSFYLRSTWRVYFLHVRF